MAVRSVKRTAHKETTTPVIVNDFGVSPFSTHTYLEAKKSFAEKVVPVLTVIVIAMSFALGAMWSKLKSLEEGGIVAKGTTTGTTTQAGDQPAKPQVSLSTIKDLFKKDVVRFGDANKKLLFVEVADPSCPYCHAAAGKNPELNRQIGERFKLDTDGGTYAAPVVEMRKLVDAGNASYVYIYSNGHGNGELAQKALYCAHEKGKFWAVHDRLMTNEGYNLINNDVKNDKANAGKLADFVKNQVDAAFVKSCLESGKYDGRIAEEQSLAGSLGVQGTPGFFVNTTNFAGAYAWADMKSAVDGALK